MLLELLHRELPDLRGLHSPEAAPAIGWSPKQELGHLIDSAINNHARFVRGALEASSSGPYYAQDAWVDLHGYQEMEWADLVDIWYAHNQLIARLVARIPAASLEHLCKIGDGAPATLSYLIEDYVAHMQHHLDHLLRREKITVYPR